MYWVGNSMPLYVLEEGTELLKGGKIVLAKIWSSGWRVYVTIHVYIFSTLHRARLLNE